ncbi:hypothetical protein A8A01_15275 [Ewingella americana]|nr:hypothetical protein A8A01_15275 [Ewingella americana]
MHSIGVFIIGQYPMKEVSYTVLKFRPHRTLENSYINMRKNTLKKVQALPLIDPTSINGRYFREKYEPTMTYNLFFLKKISRYIAERDNEEAMDVRK